MEENKIIQEKQTHISVDYRRDTTPLIEGETWKNIQGFIGYYKISNIGRVITLGNTAYQPNRKVLLQQSNKKGYCQVSLTRKGKKKTVLVHRLVALHFIANPLNLPQVNHKNLLKFDNNVGNLEWTTDAENRQHGVKHGAFARGENSYKSKLKETEVCQIIKDYDVGKYSVTELSVIYNVHYATIDAIIKKRNWKHVSIKN